MQYKNYPFYYVAKNNPKKERYEQDNLILRYSKVGDILLTTLF